MDRGAWPSIARSARGGRRLGERAVLSSPRRRGVAFRASARAAERRRSVGALGECAGRAAFVKAHNFLPQASRARRGMGSSAQVNEPNERWGGVGKTPPQTHSQLQTEGVVLAVYFPGAQESAQVRASGKPGVDADVGDGGSSDSSSAPLPTSAGATARGVPASFPFPASMIASWSESMMPRHPSGRMCAMRWPSSVRNSPPPFRKRSRSFLELANANSIFPVQASADSRIPLAPSGVNFSFFVEGVSDNEDRDHYCG